MTEKHQTTEPKPGQVSPSPSEKRPSEVAADAEQRELWAHYIEQQSRRSCPGCGEAGDAVL